MTKSGGISRRRFLGVGAGLAAAGLFGSSAYAALDFEGDRQRLEDQAAKQQYPKFTNLGTVKHLSILPLYEWRAAREGLATGPGVSYLVRTEQTTLLFDAGLNPTNEHPSPLLRNAAVLGVNLEALDGFFLSHAHPDHTGGASDRVALSASAVDLRGIPAYLPAPVACPTTQTQLVAAPRVLAPGLASLGPLTQATFITGDIVEQSLVVDVEGKGLVVVVGCGHPGVQRILARAEEVCATPLYGVIGGLHLPATDARQKTLGVALMRYLLIDRYPWQPLGQDDARAAIAALQLRRPRLVALSGHDSCDWTLGAFKEAFGPDYRDVRVGEELVVA
ncbi:MAG: MBL fold metallo-hydrolase [Chloroflexota bacterium]